MRKLIIGGAITLVVLGIAAAIIVPRIDTRKDRLAADDARAHAALVKQRRLQAIHEQRPRTQAFADLKPAAGASGAALVAARVALLSRAESTITADAKQRAATGELKGNPSATSCEPYPPTDSAPERDVSVRRAAYDCFVAIDTVPGDKNNLSGHVAYPFRAVLDFKSSSVAWCRMNLVPGEKVIPDPAFVTALPAACRLPAR